MPDAARPDADRAAEREFVAAAVRAEGEAVLRLLERLSPSLHDAVDAMARCAEAGGSVLVSGLGKSGLIGKKISATLASLGVPSHDVHPTEAAHGDLGRFRPTDCLLALSYSGETEEVVALAAALKQDGVPVVAITGGPADARSSLARVATAHLTIGAVEEACPETLAPTSSTTAMLALGDALALAVARRLSRTVDDFRKRHPGGGLGGLLRPVTDILRFTVGRNLPVAPETATVADALVRANELGRRPGALLLVDAHGRMTGLFTDGDLRRLVLRAGARAPEEMARPIREVMTRSPCTLPSTALVRDAVRLFRERRQDEIPVIDEDGRPVGILDVQDLIAIRVVQD